MSEERIAIVLAAVACANIRCAGMQAENQERARNGYALAYGEKAFQDVILEEGINWNAVHETLYR